MRTTQEFLLSIVLNKSWKQYPIKQQLYDHLPPILQTNQVRCTGRFWRNKDKLMSDVLLWTLLHWHVEQRTDKRKTWKEKISICSLYMCVSIWVYYQLIYKGCSESSKPHPEKRVITEDICCGNLRPLLIKLQRN